MRPKPIVYFEWLYLATLLMGVVQSYLNWDRLLVVMAKVSSNPSFIILVTQVLTFALIITLVLIISRRRSKVAMWIMIVLFVLGLPTVIRTLTSSAAAIGAISPLSTLITIVQMAGQLAAFGLLFTPAARRWMNRQEGPAELRDTFS